MYCAWHDVYRRQKSDQIETDIYRIVFSPPALSKYQLEELDEILKRPRTGQAALDVLTYVYRVERSIGILGDVCNQSGIMHGLNEFKFSPEVLQEQRNEKAREEAMLKFKKHLRPLLQKRHK